MSLKATVGCEENLFEETPAHCRQLELEEPVIDNEALAKIKSLHWETAEPFISDWIRSELGPEAYYADRIIDLVRALKKLPELIERIDQYYPPRGAAPPPPPLPEIAIIERPEWWGYALVALVAAAAGALVMRLL